MSVSKFIFHFWIYLGIVWSLTSCNSISNTIPIPTETNLPTSVPTVSTPKTTNIKNDTGWILLPSNIEKRQIDIYDEQSQLVENLHIFRINQELFKLDVSYHETPQTLEDWLAENKAALVVNGGYFRIEGEKYIPDGLIIANGELFGNSYGDFAGMLSINKDGANLRWLTDKPYTPGEKLLAAVQSFPVLVKPNGQLGFTKEHEDHLKARRTVIGQDMSGNILFIIAPKGYFTLHQLALYLTESDLNLDIAVNLDGGPSSGIVLKNAPQESIPAETPLPIVILVYSQKE